MHAKHLYFLIFSAALLTGCPPLDDDGVELNNASPLLPGQRGESCSAEQTCAEGLACQGGFCQIPCASSEECAIYTGTFCIAPELSKMDERFCLKQNDYTCDHALDGDAFCASIDPEKPLCSENACVAMSSVDPDPNGCVDDRDCAAGSLCNTEEGVCQAGCRQDSTCPDGAVCDMESMACVPSCTIDEDCESTDEACLPRDTQGVSTCQTIASCDLASSPDAWCQRQQGSLRYACTDKACQMVERASTFIQVLDLSIGDACSATRQGLNEPGADLIALELFDADGMLIGHGRIEDVSFGEGDSDFISTAHLDGLEPEIDNGGCPLPDGAARFRQDAVLSLGCGGYAFFQFLDASLSPIELAPGMTIGVSEYGPLCDDPESADEQGEDRYEVYLCEDLDDDGEITNAECDRQISDLPRGGYNFYDVPS